MRYWVKKIILLLLCAFVFGSLLIYFKWQHFLNTPLNKGNTAFVIQVKPGQSTKTIVWNLKKQQQLSSPRFFMWLVHLKDASSRIKVGDYLISSGIKPAELIEKMISGEVVLSRFTIIDGWTVVQLIKKMHENPNFSHTLQETTPDQLMEKLTGKRASPEGQFYPDTYLFHRGTTDIEILKKAYQKMQMTLQKAWENRGMDQPYKTIQEALIAASLIQKETRLVAEYPKISAVIRNRLIKNMPLQMDPTVIYGLRDQYTYPLTHKQLLMDTPYNTYTRKGLPPTPIAMVNEQALHAALHPDSSDILYFVANAKGGHTFTHEFKHHRTAVIQYRKGKQKPAPFKLSTQVCPWVLGWRFYAK